MSRPTVSPRLYPDKTGKLRLKLKRGRFAPDYGVGAHAHYFDAEGRRVDSAGKPVEARSDTNFRKIRWDLDEQAIPEPGAQARLPEALALAKKSPTFAQAFDEVSRAGFAIEVARRAEAPGVRKGPNSIAVAASPRSAFVARFVHDVFLARALAAPLPIVDPSDPAFSHDDAVFLLKREGSAALSTAIARDEILAHGGPDIGGPGLRGSQIEAYLAKNEGRCSPEEAADAIGLSEDGAWAVGFDRRVGPRVAANLARAFAEPGLPPISRLHPGAVDVLERVDARTCTAYHLARALEVELGPAGAELENPYFVASTAKLSGGPFASVLLREPAQGAAGLEPRVLFFPASPMSYFDFAAWYGPGTPWHVDPLDRPLATVAYALERRTLYVTYVADDARAVRSITIHPRLS